MLCLGFFTLPLVLFCLLGFFCADTRLMVQLGHGHAGPAYLYQAHRDIKSRNSMPQRGLSLHAKQCFDLTTITHLTCGTLQRMRQQQRKEKSKLKQTN